MKIGCDGCGGCWRARRLGGGGRISAKVGSLIEDPSTLPAFGILPSAK